MLNTNPHLRCSLCSQRVAEGDRIVWAGPAGYVHYTCRFPPKEEKAAPPPSPQLKLW